jgi:hypothetical protein
MWSLEDARCGFDFDRVSNSGTSTVTFDIGGVVVPKTGLSVCFTDNSLLAICTWKSNAVRPSVTLQYVSMACLYVGEEGEATCSLLCRESQTGLDLRLG